MAEYQLPKLGTRVRFPSLAFACFILFLSGCASVDSIDDGAGTRRKPQGRGVYHKVNRGETLWRIAQAYQVSIDQIIQSNQIPNVAQVEENQLIFIPGAEKVLNVAFSDTDSDQSTGDGFSWPVEGKIINYFADSRAKYLNQGIGIKSQPGETVRAAREGKVIFADYLTGFDYMVVVDHFDGFYTVYCQNSSLDVKLGDRVSKGQGIAEVGKSGDVAFLHFEIRKDGRANNPLYFLPRL